MTNAWDGRPQNPRQDGAHVLSWRGDRDDPRPRRQLRRDEVMPTIKATALALVALAAPLPAMAQDALRRAW